MPKSIYNASGEKLCPECGRYYPPIRDHWSFQFGRAGAPCKNCRRAARGLRVFNEAGEQQCRACKKFFPPSAEHFYIEEGRPRPRCRSCEYQRKVVPIKAPTEAGMLRKFRAQTLSTAALYQFLAGQHGKDIARRMVDQERKALGLPPMMAEVVYE